MVVDADAINLLANHRQAINSLPKGSILTPHPTELERLVGMCQSSYDRLSKAAELARVANIHIVLKGAFTAIITPSSSFFFNPTGNPGMATAGSGDVLTGVILALLAQGYSSDDACKLGVFVHGLAGDFAKKKLGEIGMTASDIVDCLPMAFKAISE
jgi:NAD(P)H-hydrate epimerase